jgi:hypothetical protein
MQWIAPWEPVVNGPALESELRREIVMGHPLYGRSAVAVARRVDCDDVLFRVDHARYKLAVVHLTWRMKPEPDPTYPQSQLFADWNDWIANCMKPDNNDYLSEGGSA